MYHNIVADLVLKLGDDAVGATYDLTLSDGKRFTDVWLCPALLEYYSKPPEHFAAMVTPGANRHKIMDETAPA
jgi:hypothetical protein